MSESTNSAGIRAALLLGSVVLLLLGIFGGWFFAGMEIAGVHSVGPYHIAPFADDPHMLESGLGSATPIVRFAPYSTGISSEHARQSIVLSLFSLVADTALREPVRFCTPILFALLGVILLLRFAPKKRPVSVVPQKILEYVAEHPAASLAEIVKGAGVWRGSVVHHLRKLLREQKVYKSSGSGRARYAIKKEVLDSVSIQRERVGRYPTAEKILHYLAEKPGQSRKQIAEDLTMSVSVVYWHLVRLEKLHRVLRKKSGRSFTYRLKEKEE